MSEKTPGHALTFAFLDPSPSFAHGFLCGQIWQEMQSGKAVIERTVLAAVVPTIEAMAMAHGWVERIEPIGGGWYDVRLEAPTDHMPGE